jgi:hypothetical protein
MIDVPGAEPDSVLHITWSAIYHPEWDTTPQAYVTAGLVGWDRSRRLAKAYDPSRGFTSYLGVQHFDPTRWNVPGRPVAKFFASFLVRGRTAALRTFPTMTKALAEVQAFHARLEGTQAGEAEGS